MRTGGVPPGLCAMEYSGVFRRNEVLLWCDFPVRSVQRGRSRETEIKVSKALGRWKCGRRGLEDDDLNFLKLMVEGVPVVAQWLTNPTGNHEVAGLVPALAQWVNDPALP